MPDPTKPNAVAPDYDDRPTIFTASLNGVSAKEEKIPDLPIVALAENEVTLPVIAHNAPAPEPKTIVRKEEWQRWNDYGIGLFLQGDLKGAAAAFQKVTEADPSNPDGWVNIGRCAVQEGDMARARTVLEKALSLSPNLARANFFYAKVLRADGNYEGAARRLRTVLAQYPRDRVAINDLGRILFLQRKYDEAVKTSAVSAGDRSRRPAGALQPDALLQRPRPGKTGQGTRGPLHAVQGRRIVAGDHWPLPPASSGRQQRAASRA